MKSSKQRFGNAKACFKENLDSLPNPGSMGKSDSLLWNLSKGLHDLTEAIETRFDELEARIERLEKPR
jgi:hypothetical protein